MRAQRALELLRAICATATPRAFELCFASVGRADGILTDAIAARLANGSVLTEGEVDTLHARHVRNLDGMAEQAEETALGLLQQIEAIRESSEAAQGSAQRYGASLEALAVDPAMSTPSDLQMVLAALADATREMADANRTLQRRMVESRGEVECLRRSLDDARRETLLDPLTGIANRRQFDASFAGAASEAAADGQPLSLILLDIDHFKRFNDTFGHATGDQVLRLVSTTMREQVRTTDTLARFGGEEFAVVLPGCELAPAEARADAIRLSVMGRDLVKRSTGESLGRVTVSAGIATLRPGEAPASLIERADLCLYRAKREGRNRIASDRDGAALHAA